MRGYRTHAARTTALALAALLLACAAQPASRGAPPGAAVRGVVFDEDGHPVAAAQVRLSCSCLPRSLEAVTDPDGAYVFQDLPAGTYSVLARRGARERLHTLEVAQGSKQRIDLHFVPLWPFRISARRPL